MFLIRTFVTLFCTSCLITPQVSALQQNSVDAETGLLSWKLNQQAFSLELIQRLPDQTRAFFAGRGFSSPVANDIATQCVLQAIGKNISSEDRVQSVSYNLADWRIKSAGSLPPDIPQGVKLKEQWDAEWGDDRVAMGARIAFRWATFPTEQAFQAGGDYNWGMISFGLPPGTAFDLQLFWKQDGLSQSAWINQIKCPEDR